MSLGPISVVGLGYVGLPLALEFAKAGLKVFGIEQNPDKVEKVNRGESYIEDVDSKELKGAVLSGGLTAFTEFYPVKDSNSMVICVPTPLTLHKEPDISYIVNVTNEISKFLKRGQLIILESTTYPGTTEEVVLPILEKSGLKAGVDFYLAFSPERVDPGNKKFTTKDIPKVVGGINQESTELAGKLYSHITDKVYPVSSPKVAEMTKLLENIFRLVNISFVNELALLCQRMNIDIWEVISGASTKPYGFMPFYPGPGLGGHCIIGEEMVLVKNCDRSYVLSLKELFEKETKDNDVFRFGDLEYISPENLFINSIDPSIREQSLKPITHLFKRNYSGKLIKITTNDNRTLTVTDKHPMLKIVGDRLEAVEAEDLKTNDLLPIFLGGISENSSEIRGISIDLIKELDESWNDRVRVKLKNGSWRDYKDIIYSFYYKENRYDYIRGDYIPLGLMKKIDAEVNIDHKDLILLTGRGPSLTVFPAVINIDEDLARFIGYYLSEGCATKEGDNYRIRITINRDELELYEDIKAILQGINIKCSEYLSPFYKSRTIRINSPLLGWLLIERLNCGRNSYSMKIPEELMSAGHNIKKSIIMGLFRGDGDAYVRQGKRKYIKNGKNYAHNDNSLTVGFFTINNTLLHQILYLLQEMGIHPSIKKGKNRILVTGYDQLLQISEWFLDEKRRKVEKYLNGINRKTEKRFRSKIPSVVVKKIEVIEGNNVPVYSLEVADTHTFAVGKGVYVHNCIPIDPFYLSWKAKEYDFDVRFIELAGEINDNMPKYIVQLVMEGLNKDKKAVNGSKILVIGIAYKPNIADPRESPALKIIPELERLGGEVEYYDPYIKEIKIEEKLYKSCSFSEEKVKDSDCTLIITDHDNIDYFLIFKNAKRIVDTRNALRRRGIEIDKRVERL
ncbi:TPA: nucleotide sugar dehydrogenase [bacterium]|nr:nucleotide sugar dehydrogenase [bacterium]